MSYHLQTVDNLDVMLNDDTGAVLVDAEVTVDAEAMGTAIGENITIGEGLALETGGNLATLTAAVGGKTDAPVADNTTVEDATSHSGISVWKRIANALIAILAKLPSYGTAGSAHANVLSVQGIGSGTSLGVSGTVTANAGTNLNTSALAVESGGNLAVIASSSCGGYNLSNYGGTVDSAASPNPATLLTVPDGHTINHLMISNTSSYPFLLSWDGGTTWHYFPESTSMAFDCIAIHDTTVKAQTITNQATNIYASAWGV
jgi:hypothetical protein